VIECAHPMALWVLQPGGGGLSDLFPDTPDRIESAIIQ